MAMTNYFNRVEIKGKRRALRAAETAAEEMLWERLRARRLAGLKFRRQHSAGVDILDFYCPACHLAVEIDGSSHAAPDAQEYDAERTAFLATLHIRVLRFSNAAVYGKIDGVLEAIAAAAGPHPETSFRPSPSERRG